MKLSRCGSFTKLIDANDALIVLPPPPPPPTTTTTTFYSALERQLENFGTSNVRSSSNYRIHRSGSALQITGRKYSFFSLSLSSSATRPLSSPLRSFRRLRLIKARGDEIQWRIGALWGGVRGTGGEARGHGRVGADFFSQENIHRAIFPIIRPARDFVCICRINMHKTAADATPIRRRRTLAREDTIKVARKRTYNDVLVDSLAIEL